MAKAINEREIVAAILMEVTENGRYSHIVLREVLTKYQYLEKRERAFITRVTEGTLEHMTEIDYILDCFSKVKVKDEAVNSGNFKKRGLSDKIYGQYSRSCSLQ